MGNMIQLQLRAQLPEEGAKPFPLRLQAPALLIAGAAPASPKGHSPLPRTCWREGRLQIRTGTYPGKGQERKGWRWRGTLPAVRAARSG